MRFCSNLTPLLQSAQLTKKAKFHKANLKRELLNGSPRISINSTSRILTLEPDTPEYLAEILSHRCNKVGICNYVSDEDDISKEYLVQVFSE